MKKIIVALSLLVTCLGTLAHAGQCPDVKNTYYTITPTDGTPSAMEWVWKISGWSTPRIQPEKSSQYLGTPQFSTVKITTFLDSTATCTYKDDKTQSTFEVSVSGGLGSDDWVKFNPTNPTDWTCGNEYGEATCTCKLQDPAQCTWK